LEHVVPVSGLWLTDGTSLNDVPVVPHHIVNWTLDDYRGGRDSDMIKALSHLKDAIERARR
jgi:hypothetical protein